MKICAVIPTHNHHDVLADVVARIREYDLPVIIIDDGSNTQTHDVVASLHDPENGVTCQHLDENGGKGVAVMAGLAIAERAGFTHAIQVDADGQHNLDRIEEMIRIAREDPAALITGLPVYDDSIPEKRRIGRWISHVWVWIETLSTHIRDSMCGFRVYPVSESLAVWREEGCGHKMDFDTELMVRLYWRGVPIHHVPTEVTYPENNTSNFRMWKDNVLISWMHTRLFFGMLVRLPGFIARGGHFGQKHRTGIDPEKHPETAGSSARHWSEIDERGMYWGIRFLGMVYRYGGRRLCMVVMFPIIAYFFATGRIARRASQDFLTRIAAITGQPKPGLRDSFRHFMNFGESALDKIAAWSGELKIDDLDLPDHAESLFDYMPRDQAVILFVSHFGNIELVRAIASRDRDFRVNVLLHQKNAARFGRVLQKFAPESQVDLIEVTEIGPDTAMLLREKVERGEWIVIAADRVAIGARDKSVRVPFLGDPAPFPQGPFVLAHLLQCPVYMAAAWRNGNRFEIAWEKLADKITLPRANRVGKITEYAEQYAGWLEKLVVTRPLQWFNFYDFWANKKDNNE
ncbi:glycosyltransferase family 2 protein [Thalassospira sp.]|uniref:glycosyltransferase family 2 protein n=1 Tax=Thalassospira sp. TaxID=1912094 RepID=UPI00262FB7FD|nr:glycosyltransferase family 2 protein [Thalassospira sp.]MCH2276622.1 glycosyltransferase family 2 protein [Thalassospira sp.]